MAHPTQQSQAGDRPDLSERAFAAGCTRMAVVSLHPGAGARTVLERVVSEFDRRGVPAGITRSPRVPLDGEDALDEVTRIRLPGGTFVATTERLAEGNGLLELVERTGCPTALGDLGLYWVRQDGEVPVYGPDDPSRVAEVLSKLESLGGGLALVDGAWERRSFASPDVVQGIVLVVGSGYSGSPERSADAVRFLVESLNLQVCDDRTRGAWFEIAVGRWSTALDEGGIPLGELERGGGDPGQVLRSMRGIVSAILVPGVLRDDLLAPLTRSPVRCRIVVRDGTRLQASPVYFEAWLKGGGCFEVVQSMDVLAVATNPTNPTGLDAEPDRFRRLVEHALPGIPVHDVRLESEERPTKRSWRFW